MNINTYGVDLSKKAFHVIGVNKAGKVVFKQQFTRAKFTEWLGNISCEQFAMEACGSSHYWARKIESLGIPVKQLAPKYVKGFLQGNKNDFNDAKAIAEAAQRPERRTVATKTLAQQDTQHLHRSRALAVRMRTSLAQHIRGMLAEHGIIGNQGLAPLRKMIEEALGNEDNELTGELRHLLKHQQAQLSALDKEVAWYTQQITRTVAQSEVCQKLMSVPGFGPIVSSVFSGVIGNGRQFKRGRDASASIGLVPRQHSTGGKVKLLGISKVGDSYLRSLLVHGARAVVNRAKTKTDKLSRWINKLVLSRGKNKAIVALANKLARIGWAVIVNNTTYQAAV